MTMLVFTLQKHEPGVVEDETETIVSQASNYQAPLEIGVSLSRETASLPRIRRKKVLAIRRQIAEGRYELDERLTAALDKFIRYVIAEESQGK